MATHEVRRGECVSSIAARYGSTARRIWSDPKNESLRSRRPCSNVLAPGDAVFVPEPEPKTVAAGTGRDHTFVVLERLVRLRLRLVEGGEPLARAACVLTAGEHRAEGTTDANGLVELSIPATAAAARLEIAGRPPYGLEIGVLEPVGGVLGVKQRLANLGLFAGALNDRVTAAATAAIRDFQASYGLECTGIVDDRTRDALLEAHGC
jgi:N-acetylmuramoyl-L-alanine amidase